jgi:hypothetical protein
MVAVVYPRLMNRSISRERNLAKRVNDQKMLAADVNEMSLRRQQ